VLGTVLNSGYRDAVDVTNLPSATGQAVQRSASAGTAVAARLGDPGLLDSVRSAFTHGMDRSLLVAAVVALVGAVLALAFLPARPERPTEAAPLSPVSPLPTAESVA
jgi:hypothetical protein